VGASNTLKSRNITIKQRLPNIYIIDTGLSENDKFLLEGVQMVNDDDKIIPDLKTSEEVFNSLSKE
jgi:membrane fusion protein (multidrug efflux system)